MRRLIIFVLTLLMSFLSSGLSGSSVGIAIAEGSIVNSVCVGGNVFDTTPGVVHVNDISQYRMPLVGFFPITNGPYSGHSGREAIDFSAASGTPVVAAREGIVHWKSEYHDSKDGYGTYIEIDHSDDERSIYAHLSGRVAGLDGTWVSQGTLIGYTGNSGIVDGGNYHLHFEVKKDSSDTSYVNIRQLVGIHFFTFEQQDRDLNCSIGMPPRQNDGYSYGTATAQVGLPNVKTACRCDLSNKGVIVYDADECQGSGYSLIYDGNVFNAGEMGFDVSSIYIPNGWSVFIDDGNLQEKNHLCATSSLWDLNMDYYHPVPNRLIAGNVNRLIVYKNTNCGGRGINVDGELLDLSQYPSYTLPSGGGGDPAPDPGDSSTPPTPDPSSNVGVRFFTEKQYQGSSTKLGYGTYDFTTNFLSVQMDRNDMHFYVYDSVGNHDCFDFARFGNSTQYPSFNDHGDWWDKTVRVSVESGVCPGSPNPNRKVTFYSEKHYQGASWQKQVGFDGGMTDNFYSVRIDEGISFILTNTFGQQRCFDKFSFNGNNEYPSFNDHGDWWDNTVAVKVQSIQCPPAEPNIQSPGVNATVPYGNVVVQYQPYLGSESIRGELRGLSEIWYFSQPDWVTSWNLGAIPAGTYTVNLWAVSSHGASNVATRSFTVAEPNCNDMSFGQIAVFTSDSCHGPYIALEPGWWSFSGDFYKNISSIFIPQGWSAEVIQNGNTSDGPAECLNWSMWDLSTDNYHQSDQKIGDNIQSIIIFNAPNCGRESPNLFCHELSLAEVAIFDYTYCKGPDRVLPTGTHILYGFNDLASSLYIPSGKSVKVWKGYFTGPHVCWTGSKWILGLDLYYGLAENADNNISVVEVFDDDHCGTPLAPELYPVTGSYGETDIIAPNTYVEFWWSDVGAESYQFELHDSTGELVLSDVRDAYTFFVNKDNLTEGTYTWRVKAIMQGYESEWSERTLTVQAQSQEDTCYDKIPQSGVVVFERRYCGGNSLTLAEGTHDFSSTTWNDVVSSITLADGYSALISENKAGESGGMRCITGWMWDFAVDTYKNTGGIINDTITT
ncbi:M23 family metallopeptidase, partial [Candidatus Kaiserbacteria bacterium]|nr:M23 family metallopeptidase [Candidatus Kaiserbacteria bacterium]